MARLILWHWQRLLLKEVEPEWANVEYEVGPSPKRGIEFPNELLGVLLATRIIKPDEMIMDRGYYRLAGHAFSTTIDTFRQFLSVLKAHEKEESEERTNG